MSRKIESVLVLGLGKVGMLVATLLHREKYRVTGMDAREVTGTPFRFVRADVTDETILQAAMREHDAVVTCLTYHMNPAVARSAHATDTHYFDLTEDVHSTEEVRRLSATSKRLMAPQCGLAPGFISIVGADLARRFDALRSIELRVGALPQSPRGQLGYAFNWSPEGVVNEYLNECEVIRDGRRVRVPAMEQIETIVIDGVQLEAFTTSGGLGTMCETFEGRVSKLNYKTIRYPGHCHLMQFFFNELLMRDNRKLAGEILVNAKPPVRDDLVYVHAAAEGMKNGVMGREEYVRSFYPLEIEGATWKAISWTTASSVCAAVELVARGDIPDKGFLKQEDISLEKFFATPTGAHFLI